MSQTTTPTPASATAPRPPMMARGPMGPGIGPSEKPKDFKGTMRSLLKYLKVYWIQIILVVLFAIVSTIFAIASPKILGQMTNQVVGDYINIKIYDQFTASLPAGFTIPAGTKGEALLTKLPATVKDKIPADKLDSLKSMDLSTKPGIDWGFLTDKAYLLIGFYLLSAIFSYIQGWMMSGVSQKITYNFRRDIAAKINRLPLGYFDQRTHGEVLSRVTNDVDSISQNLNQSLSQIVTSITMIIGILVMMLTISWQMTIVALLVLPISFGLIGGIVKKSQHYFKEQQETLGDLNGHVEEMYSGHNVMRVFNGEKRSVDQFTRINHKLYTSAWRSQFLSGLMWPITNFVGNLGYVGVSVLGGWLAIKGHLQIGDIQAFIQYMNSFNQPITQSAQIANVVQSTAAAAERVFEFLGEAEEVLEQDQLLQLDQVKGEVEFDNVTFGYDPLVPVIHNFSAKIKPGQRVAIVGPTGAGKTTLVNLLMRFYDVQQGSIKIDGVDIKSLKRDALRNLFAMVLQDAWLFNGSIEANIAYAKPGVTEQAVRSAAEAAHADHFIRSLPRGYKMELNEEADNLSQGEKQLLTIARAMLASSPMLILDEATSSVDTRTEALIQKAMEKLMQGKTSFVIAHRLSTIRDADLILVINEGNIVEQGTHLELLANNGFYASIYNSQFALSVTG